MTARRSVAALIAAALVCASCHLGNRDREAPSPEQQKQRSGESPDIQAWAMMGSANINNFDVWCAGRVALVQGAATVKDSCFSGDTNIVLCTNTAAANPVMCTPGKGMLTISGTGSDVISYARVH
jgi:hypothetical protein